MTKLYSAMVLAILLMMTSGCMKVTYPVSPNITGKVIDQKTRRPVSNAQVHLCIGAGHKKSEIVKTFTDPSGIFHLANQSATIMVPFYVWKPDPVVAKLTIKADTYKTVNWDFEKSSSIHLEINPESAAATDSLHIRVELEPDDPNTPAAKPD